MNEAFLKKSSDGIVVLSFIAVAVMLALPLEQGVAATVEGGPVEWFSAFLLAIAAIVAGLTLARRRSMIWVSVTVVVMWMYLRELDYQKLFTPKSIESTGFYLRPEFPLKMRLIAAAAMIPCVLALLHVIVATWRRLKQDRYLRRPVASAVVLAVGSRLAEKFTAAAELIEEPLECGFIALVLLMVSFESWRKRGESLILASDGATQACSAIKSE